MKRLWTVLCAMSVFASASLAPLGWAHAQATATLQLTIRGFENAQGQAHVTVYANEDSWLKIPKALQTLKRPLDGDTLQVKFEGLKPGTYAVSVIHDANENGELDMRWFPFPKPKEGTGASRDPKTKMGPPKWSDSSFELQAGETKKLEVTLTYL